MQQRDIADADSPLAKKSQRLSDMISVDHTTKPARKPKASDMSSTQRSVSGPPQGLRISTPGRSVGEISPSSMISMDDLIARRSWPPVDEEQETVGIDRVLSREGTKTRSNGTRTPSSQRQEIRRVSPLGDLRSPSVMSDRSGGSISRFKSPDSTRPMSATSNRSDRSLRRIDRSRSGDLRSSNRLGGRNGTTFSARDAFEPPAGALLGLAALAGASTYATSRDKGKARLVDMEGIYVSDCLALFEL
jgi:hypothetical protein